MICPFYKNKEVFNGFNEIVEALGGRPLTEDEFKSAELRNLRSGLDYSAMEAAYTLYHRNNGNFLDLAPNGERSVLFNTYLLLFNNDRTKAILKKAEVYSDNFINWFGDWLNDPANASKVVDENGEPLIVYHGGALNIRIFRHSDNNNSNTGSGYYTDERTGEKILFDSNNAIFFSSNRFVGTSYATLYGIHYFLKLRFRIRDILIKSNKNGMRFSKETFKKGIDDIYELFDSASEFNPRFKSLKEYVKKLKDLGKNITKSNEIEAVTKMLKDLYSKVYEYSDSWIMNRSEWEYVYDRAIKLIDEYNNPEGIQRLIAGEIPETIKNEWELYKKIESHRDKEGKNRIANYEILHMTLGESRYYLNYDGHELSLWTPDYKDPKISDMTEKLLSDFFDEAKRSAEYGILTLKDDAIYQKVKSKSQEYPLFLNMKNPLSHDYEGTHLGLGYKQSNKYPFGYVAARLVRKAINDGYDGVVYENLYDPYLANNYGVLNPNLAKSAIGNNGNYSTENEDIYFHLSDRNYEKKMIVRDYYMDNMFNNKLSELLKEVSIIKLIVKKYGKPITFYDLSNEDTEQQKFSKVEDRKKYLQNLLDFYGISKNLYLIKDVRLPNGGIKVYVRTVTELDISVYIEKQVDKYVNDLSLDEINSVLLENDLLYYINPKNRLLLFEQAEKRLEKLVPLFGYYTLQLNECFEYFDKLEDNHENNLFIKTALNWFKVTNLDAYNTFYLKRYFEYARKKRADILKFKTPLDLIAWYISDMLESQNVVSGHPVSANDYPGIHYNNSIIKEDGTVIEIYDVDDNDVGRRSVCNILAKTNPKINKRTLLFSPWCLSTFSEDLTGHVNPSASSGAHWEHYGLMGKQIAMVNGFPVAFNAIDYGSGMTINNWWDYSDVRHDNINDVPLDLRDKVIKHVTTSNIEKIPRFYYFGNYTYALDEDSLSYSNDYFIISDNVVRIKIDNYVDARVTIDNSYNINTIPIPRIIYWNVHPDIINLWRFCAEKIQTHKKISTTKTKNITVDDLLNLYGTSRLDDLHIDVVRSVVDTVIKIDNELNKVNSNTIHINKSKLFDIGLLTDVRKEINNLVNLLLTTVTDYDKKTLDKRKTSKFEKQSEAYEIPYDLENLLEEVSQSILNNEYYIEDDNVTISNIYEQTVLLELYEEGISKPVNQHLERHLRKILKKFNFEIIDSDIIFEVFGVDALGAFDFLLKLIYLSKSNRNSIVFPEEFSHAFIKMMGAVYHKQENRNRWPETKVYSELRGMIEKTDFYKYVYDQYSGVYRYDNGKVNEPAIKEEALGKALAAILIKKSEIINDRSFVEKLWNWFKSILNKLKSIITKAEKNQNTNIMTELDKIAESILDGTYFNKYLKKIKDKGYRRQDYKKTIQYAKKYNGGKGYEIAKFFTSINGVLSGSVSYRAQGTLYRKSKDTFHDIDVAFGPSQYTGLYDYFISGDTLLSMVQRELIIQQAKERFPDFNIVGAFYSDGKVIINCMICEDKSLYNRFCSLSGNFNERLNHFTKSERDKMYLIDIFLNPDNSAFENAITDTENDLLLSNYTVSFKEKLKFSRAKDLYDYQKFRPYFRRYPSAFRREINSKDAIFDDSDFSDEAMRICKI